MKKFGVVAGRFRLLHVGHKEYFIRAMDCCDELHVFICDMDVKRYSTIIETRIAIGTILQKYDTPYKIHIVRREQMKTMQVPSQQWDQYIIDTLRCDKEQIIVFDSKEVYGNVLLKNQYLKTYTPDHVSVSAIEHAPLSAHNALYIVPEFIPFMNKKVVITGIESCGKTTLVKKLADLYNTCYSEEYGRYYSGLELGGEEGAFHPKDFVHIAGAQLLQDKMKNKEAYRLLLVDTDPIVTLYYLNLYQEEIMDEVTEVEFEKAKAAIIEMCKAYKGDLFIYLSPKVKFVEDGLRFLRDEQRRQEKDSELIAMYESFGIHLHIIEEESYEARFDAAIFLIEHQLGIVQ